MKRLCKKVGVGLLILTMFTISLYGLSIATAQATGSSVTAISVNNQEILYHLSSEEPLVAENDEDEDYWCGDLGISITIEIEVIANINFRNVCNNATEMPVLVLFNNGVEVRREVVQRTAESSGVANITSFFSFTVCDCSPIGMDYPVDFPQDFSGQLTWKIELPSSMTTTGVTHGTVIFNSPWNFTVALDVEGNQPAYRNNEEETLNQRGVSPRTGNDSSGLPFIIAFFSGVSLIALTLEKVMKRKINTKNYN